jgi:hypothetical protein
LDEILRDAGFEFFEPGGLTSEVVAEREKCRVFEEFSRP